MRVPVKVLVSPPLKPPRQPLLPSPHRVPAVPLTWDAPRPPPPPPARRTRLSLYFSTPPPRPLAQPARLPARARARPRPLAVARREEEGPSGVGGQGGARRYTANVGLALSRSLPGGRAGTRTRGRARGRPGGGSGSRRRWLHFPRPRGGHSSSRGQQPREPELERPGAAAAAAPRVSPGGRERGGDRRGRAVRCVVRGSRSR